MLKANARVSWLHWLWISLIVFVIDQWTKQVITAHFQYGESRYILSWFNLVLAHNTGAAFSFLADASGWQMETTEGRHFLGCSQDPRGQP